MNRGWVWGTIGVALMAGCGTGGSGAGLASAEDVLGRAGLVASSATTDVLQPGWNALGFIGSPLTSVSNATHVAGIATWNGTSYQTANLAVADVNAGQGTNRGFWVFCTGSGSFSYNSQPATAGNASLQAGWNLVAFPSSSPLPGASLRAFSGSTQVALGNVVLPQFNQINPDRSYTVVDVLAGGTLQPGLAFWVFAASPVTLAWGATPGASPSPRSSPGSSPAASPSSSPTSSPSASPTASPSASPATSPTASPSPAASPSPSPSTDIAMVERVGSDLGAQHISDDGLTLVYGRFDGASHVYRAVGSSVTEHSGSDETDIDATPDCGTVSFRRKGSLSGNDIWPEVRCWFPNGLSHLVLNAANTEYAKPSISANGAKIAYEFGTYSFNSFILTRQSRRVGLSSTNESTADVLDISALAPGDGTDPTQLNPPSGTSTDSTRNQHNQPELSDDGSKVFFSQFDVRSGTNTRSHWIYTIASGTFSNVPLLADNTRYKLAGGGDHVVFEDSNDRVSIGDTNGLQDVFIRNLTANTTAIVSAGQSADSGLPANPVSADGRFVLFYSGTALKMRDVQLTTTYTFTPPAAGLSQLSAGISSNGRHIVALGNDGKVYVAQNPVLNN